MSKMFGLAACVALALPCMAGAGTINTFPATSLGAFDGGIGSDRDAYGGSFFADASRLDSFILEVASDNMGVYRAIVLDFDADGPNNLIWESGDMVAPDTATRVSFFPSIEITPGSEYLVGVDAGKVTTVPLGANIEIGTVDDTIPGSTYLFFTRQTDWFQFDTTDLAFEVQMSDVPLPPSLALVIAGMLGLFGVACRRAVA